MLTVGREHSLGAVGFAYFGVGLCRYWDDQVEPLRLQRHAFEEVVFCLLLVGQVLTCYTRFHQPFAAEIVSHMFNVRD